MASARLSTRALTLPADETSSLEGVATVRQYLEAGLIDEMHLAISPVLLGSGEHLTAGLDLPALGYACTEHVPSEKATHVVLTTRR